jgi:hypothetical protein
MSDPTPQLMLATDLWAGAMANPLAVTPTLTFLRANGPAWVVAVMDKHDLGDRDYMRAGITPMIPMSPENSRIHLAPLLKKMDVQGAIYIAPALRVGGGHNERVLYLWSLHLGTQTEVNWCRVVHDDGSLSGPVDVGATEKVGVDWVKEALR